jgi:DNA-binding transcriptional ArsR family regulator
MAQAKLDNFDVKNKKISEFAKALAHPARIAILKKLAESDTCVCGEIVEGLPLAQSTVSQHLKELQRCGLITGETVGPKSCYCIAWEQVDEFFELLDALSSELQQHNTNGCDCSNEAC